MRPLSTKSALTRDKYWCDDRTTALPESCDDQVSLALQDALDTLSARYGGEPTRWRWGDAHIARFDHSVLGRIPAIGQYFNVRREVDGGAYTVNRGNMRMSTKGEPFASVHGAAYRAIYDLGNLKQSRFIVAPGQSGNWFSPHYDDLISLWQNGGSLTIPAGRPKEFRTLKLLPKKRK